MSVLKNKPRLGRGLSSLLSSANLPIEVELPQDSTDAAGGSNAIRSPARAHASPASKSADTDGSAIHISPNAVVPNPHQPRRVINSASVAELAASLKSNGMIQPIIVRKIGDQYQLIAGERRWQAAKLAGLSTIPAILREVDSLTQAQMALVENIQREDLNPIDRAQAYRTLMTQLGLTQAELAGRMGEDRSGIANHLRLLDLTEPVQKMLVDGRLSLGHAKILAGASNPSEQERLANLVIEQGLSVRNLERLQQGGAQRVPPVAPSQRASAHLVDLEKSLSGQLGMRVQVRNGVKKGRGRLIINYASLDQFDDLLARLGVKAD